VSLRARITAATAIAVTAAVLALSAVVYASVRSHLRAELDSSLAKTAQTFLNPHNGDGAQGGGPGPLGRHDGGGQPPTGPGAPRFGATTPGVFRGPMPPAAQFGGASGYFQTVHPDGSVSRPPDEATTPSLPVDARVRAVAASGRGRFFADETVKGNHLRVLTAYDPYDHYAVQVARPLDEVDHVLHGLLRTFLLVIAGGLLLAALLGAVIGRAAVAPIRRFVRRTERVSGAPTGAERLEGGSAAELQRLATSFNSTLDALERSVAAQRHLVADASHELRTPIAALRTNIQIFLEADRLGPDEREAMQTSILAELDDLTQLVADVVELARGAEPSEALETLRLDEIVEAALQRARRRSPGLNFDVSLEPTMVANVPERVARAVINVLDNARKWSPPGGVVEITLREGTLTVRDHGPGFEAADIPHVFDRFYRAEKARRMPGSGLGLAIVRQAAEAHGGFVSASNAPDGGALVHVGFGPTLPLPAEALALADPPSPA
jgi:two-component system sensor histidine kinase MprB